MQKLKYVKQNLPQITELAHRWQAWALSPSCLAAESALLAAVL